MKATTLYAIAVLTLGGVACSETANSTQEAGQSTDVSSAPQSSEDASAPQSSEESSSGFNLNLPSSMDDSAETSGLNLNLGDSSEDEGLLVGKDSLGNGELVTEIPDINLPDETGALGTEPEEQAAEDDDDGLIHITPK